MMRVLAALALAGCATLGAATPASAPGGAAEAVEVVLAAYEPRAPRADVQIAWFTAFGLPECGWHAGCSSDCKVRLALPDPGARFSETALAHELGHCTMLADVPDDRWTDDDLAAEARAQDALRRWERGRHWLEAPR